MHASLQGETFTAQRWLLEAGSPVLKAKAALQQNATSGVLHIDDMDADVLKAMLQFMYKDALPSNCHEKIEVEPAMAERLLVAADRYGLDKLKLACVEALCARVDTGSIAAMLTLAERHGCAVLKEACVKFLSRPDNLRSFIATYGIQRLKTECPSAAAEIVAQQLP
jgi:speckle-type POZ protein